MLQCIVSFFVTDPFAHVPTETSQWGVAALQAQAASGAPRNAGSLISSTTPGPETAPAVVGTGEAAAAVAGTAAAGTAAVSTMLTVVLDSGSVLEFELGGLLGGMGVQELPPYTASIVGRSYVNRHVRSGNMFARLEQIGTCRWDRAFGEGVG
jgi:hypothetical protein